MQQTIKTPKTLRYGSGQLVVVGRKSLLQIQHRDYGFRSTCSFNLGMHGLQFASVSANQDHGRTDARASNRYRSANSAARARNGYYAPDKLVGERVMSSRIEGITHLNSTVQP